MGYAAAAGIGLSVAGDVFGPLLGDDAKPAKPRVGSPELDTSPGLKIAEFMNLIEQGIYDPSALMQSSPLNIGISEFYSTAAFNQKTKGQFLHELQQMRDRYREGAPLEAAGKKTLRMIEQLLLVTGYTSIEALFAAEDAYQQNLQPMLQSAQAASQGNFQAKLNMQTQIRDLLAGLPDASAAGIASLRADEKSRLLRDLNRSVDEQRDDVLALANVGNFNPGRPVGDLEEFRARSTEDADLIALSRALALIGGEQSVAGTNLGLLMGGTADTFNRSVALAQADQGFRAGTALVTPGVPANNALATGVSAGLTGVGQGIINWQQGQLSQQRFEDTLAAWSEVNPPANTGP